MCMVNTLLDRLARKKSRNVQYVRDYLETILELGYIPKGSYKLAAGRSGVREDTFRQGICRIVPSLWEAGSGIFHKPGTPCPKPKDALGEMIFYLSGGKIL